MKLKRTRHCQGPREICGTRMYTDEKPLHWRLCTRALRTRLQTGRVSAFGEQRWYVYGHVGNTSVRSRSSMSQDLDLPAMCPVIGTVTGVRHALNLYRSPARVIGDMHNPTPKQMHIFCGSNQMLLLQCSIRIELFSAPPLPLTDVFPHHHARSDWSRARISG